MNRFFSLPAMLLPAAVCVLAVASMCQAQELEFRAGGDFTIISVEDHVGHVIVTGASEPGGSFEGALVERYSGNLHKIGNIHKIRGAGVFDYGGGHTLTFDYELDFDAATNLDEGPVIITGGTGAFAGASGSGILVADHDLAGQFELLGTIFW